MYGKRPQVPRPVARRVQPCTAVLSPGRPPAGRPRVSTRLERGDTRHTRPDQKRPLEYRLSTTTRSNAEPKRAGVWAPRTPLTRFREIMGTSLIGGAETPRPLRWESADASFPLHPEALIQSSLVLSPHAIVGSLREPAA